MASKKIDLNANGQAVTNAAALIYAAFVAQGKVKDGDEEKWLERAIKDAVRIARTVTKVVERDASGVSSSSGAAAAKTNSKPAPKPAAKAPAPAAKPAPVAVEAAAEDDDTGFELELDESGSGASKASDAGDSDDDIDDLLSLMDDELED
jgi:hypothetical protein